jgi:ACS family sodium-dependent inorganic phosphate cotransporter
MDRGPVTSKFFFIQQTLGQWQIIFYTTAAIYVVEFVVYAALASGEEQSWNKVLQHKNCNVQELEECR